MPLFLWAVGLVAALCIVVIAAYLIFPDFLHPQSIVTHAADFSAVASGRKVVSKWLYEYISTNFPNPEWTCMNYGYEEPAVDTYSPGHLSRRGSYANLTESEKYSLQLYQLVATSTPYGQDISGLKCLEVGSGRGGGSAFIARTMRPQVMTGVDISEPAVLFSQQRFAGDINSACADGRVLEFKTADAENLLAAVPPDSYHLVVNVESAHCYASLPRFLEQVMLVLKPGGFFCFADFIAKARLPLLHGVLEGSGMVVSEHRDITDGVLAALNLDHNRKADLLAQIPSALFRSFATGAYAMRGTSMYNSFVSGRTRYVLYVLRKPPKSSP